MATKVKAAVMNRALVSYRKDQKKVQGCTNVGARQLAEAGDSKAIGRMGEYLVKAELEDLGYEVKLLSGADSCDLKIKIGQSWKRIEVKTSKVGLNTTVRKDGTRSKIYCFNSIKTELFDMIVFVFIDYDRTVIKVGGEAAKRHIELWGSDGHNGKCLCFGENMRNHKERGQQIFSEIKKENVKTSLKG